jgi:hypothetical protein
MSTSDGFVPHIEEMDLSKLYDRVFIVAVSTGPRDDGRMLTSTMHGPYDFDEMVGEVGRMWASDQNNAKVYSIEKDHSKRSKWLDAKTIDYIQEKYADILLFRIIGSDSDKKYTTEAGIVQDKMPAFDIDKTIE